MSEIQTFADARPFVGRQREVEAIGGALDEALAGRGRLVVLVGEPGIGKSRLADETTAAAARRGVPVLWGRCWEAGGAPAYWPWLEVLGGLGRALDDRGLEEALGEGAPLVGELVPALRARLGAPAVVMPPTADEARFRLWRSVAALVRQAATSAGLVIVLEDLHAGDEPSLVLLHYLAREVRLTRALLLASYRDVEARLSPAVGGLLDRIGREGLTLALGRLDRAASASFLRQRVGEASAEVEARIFASTQGNPLFLEEMARLLSEAGAAAVTGGDLPHGVRDAIGQRLERLPPAARPLLDLAAVAGDELDGPLLAAASGTDVEAALADATRAGVLVERGGRRRFSHALVREVLYRELGAEERRALHGKVAAALGTQRGYPPLAELAHHLIAGPVEGLPRAVEFSVRAAERALGTLGYEEAVAILTRAADAVEAAGNPAALRAQVLITLADARIRRGESAEGKTLCREVAILARGLGDTELLARAALTYGLVWAFAIVDPVLVGLLEEALAALPPEDSPLRVRLMARLGAALQPAPRGEEPIRVAREAIAGARRLGDPATLLGALFSGMSALMFVADPRERLALNLEAEQLCTVLGDRERLLHTQMRLVMDHMELGELAAVDARIEAFETLARELRAPWYGWRALLFRSMRLILHGRFVEAERLVDEALRFGRDAKNQDIERCCVLHREGLLRAWEQHDAMLAFEPNVRRAKAGEWRASALQAAGSANLHARREEEDNTRLHLALIPEEMRPPVDFVYGTFFLVEPAVLVGTTELCARLYDLLLPLASRDAMLGLTYMTWEGPVARLLGLLAERLGRPQEADARFAAALARTEQLDAGPYLARIRYEYGRVLLARGDERARGFLAGARALAVKLGLTGLVALADRRLGADPVKVPERSDRAAFTMSREGDYWTLGHAGAVFRLKDSLGLQYLARLVAEPGREMHVLDLVGGRRGGEAGAIDTGDAGELLDPEARAQYERRLEDLQEALGEAESFGDATRAGRVREEIEFLGAELGRAVGLGGRSRRAGGAAERARSAVQRRIKNAIERVEEHDRELAAYLTRAVRTGNFCVFRPGA